jgi:hypothetical protein
MIPNATNKEAKRLDWTPVIKGGMMLDRNLYLHDTGVSRYYYLITTVLVTSRTRHRACHHLITAPTIHGSYQTHNRAELLRPHIF